MADKRQPEVTVILPTYNNETGAKDLVRDFYRLHDPDIFRIFSIDQTKEGIKFDKEYPVHLHIRPHLNLGFARAMNIGWKLVTTPYTLLANDDVRLLHSRWYDDAKACLNREGVLGSCPLSGVRTWDWDGNVVWLWDLKVDLPLEERQKNTESSKGDYTCPHCGLQFVGDHTCLASRDTRFDFVKDKPFEEWTEEDYLRVRAIHGGPTDGPGTAYFFPLFHTWARDVVGLLDEQYWNNGEDYDHVRRAYLTCHHCNKRKSQHFIKNEVYYCDKDYAGKIFEQYHVFTCMHSIIHHHCGVTKQKIEALEGASTYDSLVNSQNKFNEKWGIKKIGPNDIYGENGELEPVSPYEWYSEIGI